MKKDLHTPFNAVRACAKRLDERPQDYDELLALAAGKRFVLLGEATHGTREFYRMRADITRRLISELGFDTVAIEGDWPDAWRVNRFVTEGADETADSALGDFERFPTWMWRNREVEELISWLRRRNATLPQAKRAGFYGLDMYSLYRSADAVVNYLAKVDPEQAEVARQRYAGLDHVRDEQTYGYEVAMLLRPPARDEVVRQLRELQANAPRYLDFDGLSAMDAQFFAERNAAVVANAETYYRAMFGSRVNTWNLRDGHMRDTLFALADHRVARGGTGRIVVWAHNSHLGDARATEVHRQGEWNLGQLVREAVGDAALLVGFTTYTGYVSAASRWGGEVEHKWVRPALRDSYEHLFHSTHLDRFFLPLSTPAAAPLRESLLERAIGVIYLPRSERASHYFEASIAAQFDAIFHLDETSAVEPLDAPHHWHHREVPETYPFGV
jgi:erythromycin esterase-like protein